MPVLLTGDVLPFATTVVDAGGVEVSAGSMKLTVTGPTTGSSAVYDPVIPTAPGIYDVDHPATVAGTYRGRWVATGANAGTDLQVFNVDDDVTFGPLVGLDEAKEALNKSQLVITDDEELWRVVGSASALVEAETHLWHRVTVTQEYDPTPRLYLRTRPVVSVTSVVQDGTTIAVGSYELSPIGNVLRGIAGTSRPWAGSGKVTVTYEAGETFVPSAVREAVLLTVEEIWKSQRGPVRSPLRGQSGYEDEDAEPSIAYSLPYGAQKLLEPWVRGPLLA